jgi:hypothetical protein
VLALFDVASSGQLHGGWRQDFPEWLVSLFREEETVTDWDAIRKKRARNRRNRQNHDRLRHWTGETIPGWDAVKRYYATIKAYQNAA